jgi:uncharacterized membrane protein
MSHNFTLSLFFSLSFWFIGGSFVAGRFLRNLGFIHFLIVFCLVILSYPSLFIFVTGNLESWIAFLLLLAAIFAYQLNWNFFAICIGIAGAMKGVPLIFVLLPLFLLGKKLGAIVALKTLIVSIGLTIFPPRTRIGQLKFSSRFSHIRICALFYILYRTQPPQIRSNHSS